MLKIIPSFVVDVGSYALKGGAAYKTWLIFLLFFVVTGSYTAYIQMTEGLIKGLISGMSLPPERRKHYIQRLRHGLYYYYTQHYQGFETIQQSN